MQWFETVPGSVRVTVDAYLAAAAAHERAAEAARQAAAAAQALAVQMPVDDGAGDLATHLADDLLADQVDPGTGAGTGAGTGPGLASGRDAGTTARSAAGMQAAGMQAGGGHGVDPARPAQSAAHPDAAGMDAPAPTGPRAAPSAPLAPAGRTVPGVAGLGVAGGAPWPGELLEVLARRLPAGDLALAALNEAELAAATGAQPGEQRLVPLPHLDAMPAWARHAAVVDGHQSLGRRGLLAVDGQPGWVLAALLALRTRPRAVTVAGPERQLPAPCHYLYGAGGDVVLEEIVEPVGTHHFTLRSRASACARLARLADPYGRARASSPPLVAGDAAGPAEWATVHAAMARAEHVTQVSTTRPGPAAAQWLLLRLIAGPDGLLAIACRHAGGVGQGANARWLSGWALQRLLLACLDVAPVPAPA